VKNNTEEIIFFFYPGREKRLKFLDKISTEFLYSYVEANNRYENVKLVEVENIENSFQKIMKFYDRVIFKLCRIQSNSEKYCEKKFINLFNSNNILIFTNFALGLSAVPYLFHKILGEKNNIYVINSGLFSFRNSNFLQEFFRLIYLKLFFNIVTKIIFTSKTEYQFAIKKYSKYESRFKLIEFSPDVNFWTQEIPPQNKEKKGLLFIGNDEGRCFDLLKPLAENLKDYNFTFITNNEKINKIKLPNVEIISGNWSGNTISDLDLRDIYRRSKITILPIQNKLVASGQSVALQSMCNKTPVIITDTEGFWNRDLFENRKNLFFASDNTLNSWATLIDEVYRNDELLNQISENAYSTILKNYSKEKFDTEFLKLLN